MTEMLTEYKQHLITFPHIVTSPRLDVPPRALLFGAAASVLKPVSVEIWKRQGTTEELRMLNEDGVEVKVGCDCRGYWIHVSVPYQVKDDPRDIALKIYEQFKENLKKKEEAEE